MHIHFTVINFNTIVYVIKMAPKDKIVREVFVAIGLIAIDYEFQALIECEILF